MEFTQLGQNLCCTSLCSIVSKDSILGLRCPHMSENTFSHGVTITVFSKNKIIPFSSIQSVYEKPFWTDEHKLELNVYILTKLYDDHLDDWLFTKYLFSKRKNKCFQRKCIRNKRLFCKGNSTLLHTPRFNYLRAMDTLLGETFLSALSIF